MRQRSHREKANAELSPPKMRRDAPRSLFPRGDIHGRKMAAKMAEAKETNTVIDENLHRRNTTPTTKSIQSDAVSLNKQA